MNSYREEKREGIGMNKIIKSTLVVMLMFGILLSNTNLLAVSASNIPGNNEVEIRGRTTSKKSSDLNDGDIIDVFFDIYVDPTVDYFNAANTTIKYDSEILEFINADDMGSTFFVSPMQINSGQNNVGVGNLWMIAPESDGFVVTVRVTFRIVAGGVEKLIATEKTSIQIGLQKNDVDIVKNGIYIHYADVLENIISEELTVSLTNMEIVLTDLPGVSLSELASGVEVQKGGSHLFAITASGGTNNDVTWSIVGASSANTKIDANGLLVVGADETATTITVTAISNDDPTKSKSTAVRIVAAGSPPVVVTPWNPTPSAPSTPNTGVASSLLPWGGMMIATAGAYVFLFKKKETE